MDLLLVPQVVIFTIATLWFVYPIVSHDGVTRHESVASGHHDSKGKLAEHLIWGDYVTPNDYHEGGLVVSSQAAISHIEGFVTRLDWPRAIKIGIGMAALGAFLFYQWGIRPPSGAGG